jgi:hypothetical protein
MFSVLVLAACAQSDPYGAWEGPPASNQPTTSYLGHTGLLVTPTAMIASPLAGAVYYHAVHSQPRRQAFYGATLGLPGDLEITGIRMVNVEPLLTSPDVFRSETVLSAKYQVPLAKLVRSSRAPKVGVGVFDVSDQVARSWYLVLSQSLNLEENPHSPLTLHLGYAKKDEGGGRLDGIFAGMDFALSDEALFQAEYDGDNLNAGVRYYPVQWISVDGGVVAGNFAWGATVNSEF